MQTAYDDYWSGFTGPSAPYISFYSPQNDSVLFYQGQKIEFQINAYDRDGDIIKYMWIVNDARGLPGAGGCYLYELQSEKQSGSGSCSY
jgi:hypothetical protein